MRNPSGLQFGAVVAAVAGVAAVMWGLALRPETAGGDAAAATQPVDAPAVLAPYLPIFAAIPLFTAAVAMWLAPQPPGRARAELRVVDEDWAEAHPRDSTHGRAFREAAAAVTWAATSGFASCYYFATSPAPHAGGTVLAVVVLAVAAVNLVIVGYRHWASQRLYAARLRVHPWRVSLGEDLHVKITQEYRARAHVKSARIGLLCLQTPTSTAAAKNAGVVSKPVFQVWKEASVERDAKRGRTLRIEDVIPLPPDAQPTTTAHTRDKSKRYDWSLKLVVKLSLGPDYEAEFPIPVQPGRHQIPKSARTRPDGS